MRNKGQYYKLIEGCDLPNGSFICPKEEISCVECSRRKRAEGVYGERARKPETFKANSGSMLDEIIGCNRFYGATPETFMSCSGCSITRADDECFIEILMGARYYVYQRR